MTCFSRIPTIHILKALSGLFSEVCLLSLLAKSLSIRQDQCRFSCLIHNFTHGLERTCIGTDCGNLQSFYSRSVNQ